MNLPKAFVTLLTTPSYLPGALVLLHSLLTLHPAPRDFKIVCLVTPETVDAKTIGELRRAGFDLVIGVEPIGSGIPGQDALSLMGRPDLNLALTKLHLFRLSSLFSTIIYLDADVLPLRPLSHLFDFTAPHVLSACPDTGWPDCFNSGVMVLRPRDSDWEGMRAMLKTGEGADGVYNSNGSFDGADQGLLNEWFSEEGGGGDWNKLSFTYNVTPSAAYQYAPAYKRYGHKISAVHFIGPNKPWANLQWRPAGVSEPKGKEVAYDYPSLIDRWYAVYDKHVRPTAAHNPDLAKRFAVPETIAVWNQPGSGSIVPHQPEDRMDIEGLKAATQWGFAGSGQYTSLPLEGRVDLLMPKPKPIQKRVQVISPPKSPTAVSPPVEIVAPVPQTIEQQTEQPATWDASRYSPPKDAGPEMSIRLDTFFTPAWEQTPAQQSAWYQAPPPQPEPQYPTLPENVVKDEWYKEFTGTKPDRHAIQPVFPWEEQGHVHRKPDRVFPRGSSPPPRPADRNPQPNISVQQPAPPVPSPARRLTPSPPPQPQVPPKTMAEAMASYTNAWDDDPSIQTYISRITGRTGRGSGTGPSHSPSHSRDFHERDYSALQSVPGTPRRAARDHRRERSTDTRSTASGDGDDEDEGTDDNDQDQDPNASPRAGRRSQLGKTSLPSGPVQTGHYTSNPKYRDRHAQTDRAQMSDAKVQASPGGPSPGLRTVDLPRESKASTVAASVQVPGCQVKGDGGNGNATSEIAARARAARTSSSSDTAKPGSNIVTPPSDSVASGGRQTVPFPAPPYLAQGQGQGHGYGHAPKRPSITSALSDNFGGAFASTFGGGHGSRGGSASGGGLALATGVPSKLGGSVSVEAKTESGVPRAKASRTWDPNTDVDVRKRDTQEVLSRFMKAGGFGRGGDEGRAA